MHWSLARALLGELHVQVERRTDGRDDRGAPNTADHSTAIVSSYSKTSSTHQPFYRIFGDNEIPLGAVVCSAADDIHCGGIIFVAKTN
jgi:hypothetical protein